MFTGWREKPELFAVPNGRFPTPHLSFLAHQWGKMVTIRYSMALFKVPGTGQAGCVFSL